MTYNYNDIFVYDESSPTCLRWKHTRYKGLNHAQVHVLAGDVAGSVGTNGYFQVGVNHSLYLVHRVVYEMHKGSIPNGFEIDHDNRDKTDCRFVNLKAVTKSQNQRNKSKSLNNTSGTTCVKFYTVYVNSIEYTYAKAECRLNNKVKSKNFSVKKFGLLPAFTLAVEARKQMLLQTTPDEAAYSADHGT